MRYLLFGGETYYASGGGHDCKAISDNLGELIKLGQDLMGKHEHEGGVDWWHVIELSTEPKIVAGSKEQGYGASWLSDDIYVPAREIFKFQ